jgi:hypothetical protein
MNFDPSFSALNKNNLAPIVLFVYNRPWHTKQTLDALALNYLADSSNLYVFCDGCKEDADINTIKNVELVRNLIKSEDRFLSIEVFECSSNKGLANSIINGVTDILRIYDKIIVLEDDLLTGKGFLKFMNEALIMYENANNVGCIHGWNFNLDIKNSPSSTFFLKGADCWGWATWKRSWVKFNADGQFLLQTIVDNKLEFQFNRRGTQNFVQMLQDQIKGKNDSWAVRWHASLFLEGMYCLHPAKSTIINIGLDSSGVHCGDVNISQSLIDDIELERITVIDSEWFYDTINYHFNSNFFYLKFWKKVRNLLGF